MNQAKLFTQFSALPAEAQKVVADLIILLSKQPRAKKSGSAATLSRLSEEKFIGLWKDREEMQDSHAYIRTLRQQEWQ
jgi:hypothetical protein